MTRREVGPLSAELRKCSGPTVVHPNVQMQWTNPNGCKHGLYSSRSLIRPCACLTGVTCCMSTEHNRPLVSWSGQWLQTWHPTYKFGLLTFGTKLLFQGSPCKIEAHKKLFDDPWFWFPAADTIWNIHYNSVISAAASNLAAHSADRIVMAVDTKKGQNKNLLRRFWMQLTNKGSNYFASSIQEPFVVVSTHLVIMKR